MDEPALYLVIGYLGSALVVTSLAMRSILRLRIIGLAGAITFAVYGYLIDAWPVVLTNVVIVVIHLHFLREILTAKEYFKILEVRSDSRYTEYFLHHFGHEIEATWPGFVHEPSGQRLTLFILRDLVPAGLFIAEIVDKRTLRLCLDFAIPGYRDFKIGRYLYSKGALRDRGFRTVVADAGPERTTQYLRRIGFRADPESGPNDRVKLVLEPQ